MELKKSSKFSVWEISDNTPDTPEALPTDISDTFQNILKEHPYRNSSDASLEDRKTIRVSGLRKGEASPLTYGEIISIDPIWQVRMYVLDMCVFT